MTTVHDERIVEQQQADTSTIQTAKAKARQGDLVLWRVGDANPKIACIPTPKYGLGLIEGRHGEHRLVADAYHIEGTRMTLPAGGVVLHTDAPEGRHAAVRLAPGTWCYDRQQQLTADAVVVKQED